MKTSTKVFLAVSGILLIVLGIVCICQPVETLFASAWLIGLMTLLSGIATLVFTIKTQAFLPNSASRMLSALLQILLGIFFLAHQVALTASLPLIFACWIMVEGVTLAVESFDFKKVGFGYWWCILLLGVATAVLGYFSFRNPAATGTVMSTLIGISVISAGISYLVALAGINKFENFVKGIKKDILG